jgi:hypothetical protein
MTGRSVNHDEGDADTVGLSAIDVGVLSRGLGVAISVSRVTGEV